MGAEFVIDIFCCRVQVKVPLMAKFNAISCVIMALCNFLTVAAFLGIVTYRNILPCTSSI